MRTIHFLELHLLNDWNEGYEPCGVQILNLYMPDIRTDNAPHSSA